tara:strand:+ start:2579 stop:3427 length:849 start_codon:yes stop_codon:yes gene_type:complete
MLGGILGGLAGLLIPGLSSSVGAGIGSLLIDKKSPKDAIARALGVSLFEGNGPLGGILGAGNNKNNPLAQLLSGFNLGGAEATPTTNLSIDPPVAKELLKRAEKESSGGIFDLLTGGSGGNPMMPYLLMGIAGAAEKPNVGPRMFASKHTGKLFSTQEEADAYDQRWMAAQNARRGTEAFPMAGNDPQLAASIARNQLPGASSFPTASGYAMGGYIEGPGTGRSDSIPAQIYQDGQAVQEAALSDGEFVMTERAVKGAGNGDREKGAAKMYSMMRDFERGSA